MAISLNDIYDVLITEIGFLTIPRKEEFEIRRLTNVIENRRMALGTEIGCHHKANALFKSNIYTGKEADIVPLVKDMTIKSNGGAQDKAIEMLRLLEDEKLKAEMSYIDEMLKWSVIYRVSVNEEIEALDRWLISQKKDHLENIFNNFVISRHEEQYNSIRVSIEKRLIDSFIKMIDKEEVYHSRLKSLPLSELVTLCIAISVSELKIDATKKEKIIKEKQRAIRKYIDDVTQNLYSNIDPIISDYFLRLWSECGLIAIRDRNDERTQIEKYIYPHFSFNREMQPNPLQVKGNIYYRRMIVAESGLGKSSYLDMISCISVYRDIEEKVSVNDDIKKKIVELEEQIDLDGIFTPVLIRAGEYKCKKKGIEGLIPCIIGAPTFDEFNSWLKAIGDHSDRQIHILVDALDEIEYGLREDFLDGLIEFKEKLKNVNILVTCRPIDREYFERNSLFRGVEEWQLEPFDREQMVKFISEKIHSDTRASDINANNLLDQIVKNPYLNKLAQNPYILETMLVHSYTFGDNTAFSTIDSVINKLVDRKWNRLSDKYPQIRSGEFIFILAGIAYILMKKGDGEVIDRADLENKFVKISQDMDLENKFSKDMFKEIVGQMNNAAGLLIYENGGYKFQYIVFEQYLTAKWIYEKIAFTSGETNAFDATLIEQLLPECIEDDKWVKVITMLFSFICENEDSNEFLSTLVFRWLLNMGMGTDSIEGEKNVVSIFKDLDEKSFGRNNVVVYNDQDNSMKKYIKFVEGE